MPATAARIYPEAAEPEELQEDPGVQLARQAGMVLCRECANLHCGYCVAAAKGLIKSASKRYSPVLDIFRRCGEYRPIGTKE